MFSMEENPDYTDEAEEEGAEEPDESNKYSKSTDLGGSVVREKTRKTTTLSSEEGEEIEDEISEHESKNKPAED